MQDKEKEPDNGEEMILKLFLAMCFDFTGSLKEFLSKSQERNKENEDN